MATHSRGPVIIYLILLIALTFTLIVPQTFASPVAPGWAVQGKFTSPAFPCSASGNSSCGSTYQVTGVGGPSCDFPSPNQLSQWPCDRSVYFGTWRLLFSCVFPNSAACSAIPAPPSQGQQTTAYGTVVQPSSGGSIYAGDLYVYSWSPAPSAVTGVAANYGDQNVEQWAGTIGANVVQAYVMFTVPGPAMIRSVSMYLQYSGSDGSQCMGFGIYLDNGNGSPAGQPLIASTRNSYCLHGSVTWGPAWETWKLQWDTLAIPAAGTYWLAVLTPQAYGNIYHYAYSSSYDYTYGYSTYFFAAPASQGFPPYFSSNPAWEGNGPYSMYVTATS
jgi:hypothetical protein